MRTHSVKTPRHSHSGPRRKLTGPLVLTLGKSQWIIPRITWDNSTLTEVLKAICGDLGDLHSGNLQCLQSIRSPVQQVIRGRYPSVYQQPHTVFLTPYREKGWEHTAVQASPGSHKDQEWCSAAHAPGPAKQQNQMLHMLKWQPTMVLPDAKCEQDLSSSCSEWMLNISLHSSPPGPVHSHKKMSKRHKKIRLSYRFYCTRSTMTYSPTLG